MTRSSSQLVTRIFDWVMTGEHDTINMLVTRKGDRLKLSEIA